MSGTVQTIQTMVMRGFNDWKIHNDFRNIRVVEKDGMVLFNYDHNAVIENRWNEFKIVSRGLIINRSNGHVVARPFDKFFNWGENGRKASYREHLEYVFEKSDGSMGFSYINPNTNSLCVATRGSFESEQAQWANNFIHNSGLFDVDYLTKIVRDGWTPIFEIIYPENRIVVDYDDRRSLVLLAVRNRIHGDYLPYFGDGIIDVYRVAENVGFDFPQIYTFNDVSEIIVNCGEISNMEGYVLLFSDGSRYKIKGDEYLHLHRLISSVSLKNVISAMSKGDFDKYRNSLPEEFWDEVDGYQSQVNSEYNAVLQRVDKYYHIVSDNAGIEITDRAFALRVKDTVPHEYHRYMFSRRNGKSIENMLWKDISEKLKDNNRDVSQDT